MSPNLSRLTLCLTLILSTAASPAIAQISPPPRHDARSPTGVSYRNGSFSLEEVDLEIGDKDAGIKLVRSYNSGSDGLSDPFTAAVGWTHSFNIYISVQPLPQEPEVLQPPNYYGRCVYNIVGGAGAVGFVFTGSNPPQTTSCGGVRAGPYQPITPAGSKLELIADTVSYYRYTGEDGSVITFAPGANARALSLTKPDGTRLDFTYLNGSTGSIRSVFSSRGWAILFEGAGKACAVNRATTYVTPTSACPANAETVTYAYAPTTYVTGRQRLVSVTKGGATTNYGYADNDHVNCIREPGQTVCRIQNVYSACLEDPYNTNKQPEVRMRDPVISQTDASGKVVSYSYSADSCPQWPSNIEPDLRPFSEVTTTMSESGVSGNTVAVISPGGNLGSLTDPLGRTTSFVYDSSGTYDYESGDLNALKQPEGNRSYVLKDARGNIIQSITEAKAGSGQSNLVSSAVYPVTCSNIVTCNKPVSMTDANGNTTTYTYDPAHGGVLTMTAPAVGGVSPVTRYYYVQREAWLSNGTSYSKTGQPIWLKSEEHSCRTSTLDPVAGTCSAGASDLVRTLYDYGPESGPNNLLLRGVAVVADGQTLRTCYHHDQQGRRIAETRPLGTGTTCP